MSFTTPSFAITDWPLPTALVAHDAGSANLIISWVKAWGWPVKAYFEGPARTLWERTFPDLPLCNSIANALEHSESLITGTGWASELEHRARGQAKQGGLRTAAVLDHWVNYLARFERNGFQIWPDEFWVSDRWAEEIARVELPERPIRLLENTYLKQQIEAISPPSNKGTILYVTEPVRNKWGRNEDGEFQALRYALENLEKLRVGKIRKIIIRPHPSESRTKYEHIIKTSTFLELDNTQSIAESINQADIVIGVESFALTVAVAAGRKVYSSLPPWATQLRLPQKEIQEIRRITSPICDVGTRSMTEINFRLFR